MPIVRRSWEFVMFVVWPLVLSAFHATMFSAPFLLAIVAVGIGAGLIDVSLRPTSELAKRKLLSNREGHEHRLGLQLGLVLMVLVLFLLVSGLTLLARLAGMEWGRAATFASLVAVPYVVSFVARLFTVLRRANPV